MSLAEAIIQTQERIKALEIELERLRVELEEARLALKAEPARRKRNRKGSRLQHPALDREPYKPESSVARAVEVLREADTHLHIDDLIARIRAKGHGVEKSTLVGNLSRYVKDRKIFTRHSRSKYGLLEWQQKAINEILEEVPKAS